MGGGLGRKRRLPITSSSSGGGTGEEAGFSVSTILLAWGAADGGVNKQRQRVNLFPGR